LIFISYYTLGNYEVVMNTHLRPSLEKWNLKHYIKETKDLGNWNDNTSFKATFILNMLNKYKEDVVFLDADAIIHKYPELLFNIPKESDLACHYLDWIKHWRNQTGGNNFHLLSGTMFLRYNEKILDLMKLYIKECEKNPGIWEQKVLELLISENKDINVYKLPASYCAVIKYDGKVPAYIEDPIIVHYQASRKYKKL